MRWFGWLAVALVAIFAVVYISAKQFMDKPIIATDEAAMEALAEKIAAQNEAAFQKPLRKPAQVLPANPQKNVYFGDLHVHTSLSFDSYLFGNRHDPDTAWRIAKGASVKNRAGELMELTRPLDFAALADHAEGFGLHEACARDTLEGEGRKFCDEFDVPSPNTFLNLRKQGEMRPPVRDMSIYDNDPELAATLARSTWTKVRQAAKRHNEPGKFTAFAAYEYSPPLGNSGKHHRNVIFLGEDTPDNVISAYDAPSEIELWKQLEAGCTAPCEFITIPHNPNKTWGLAFANHTIDNVPYEESDWALRERHEPIVEMFQIKGNSECSSAFGATDEECNFEQFLPPCEDEEVTMCIHPTSMIRDGLGLGLALEDKIGFNPMAFGLIGSSDTHNSNPGDVEEWDFRGASAFISSPASRRLSGAAGGKSTQIQRNPGGLAAIWAEENTREALFRAMERKEVYATSGTRMRLRTFAGFNLPRTLLSEGDIAQAYASGVPMGGALDASQTGALDFFVWAVRDPDNAPLKTVQIIKGWIENGARHEKVFDIACSGGAPVNAQTGKCDDNGARVDLNDCSWDEGRGSSELKVMWRDEDYNPASDAFYYVRVLQNPTCRWSTYDSLRVGATPPEGVPATISEMAWSSPIWLKAK